MLWGRQIFISKIVKLVLIVLFSSIYKDYYIFSQSLLYYTFFNLDASIHLIDYKNLKNGHQEF